MPRLQILELPTIYHEGEDETPFVIIIDQATEDIRQALASDTALEADGTERPLRETLRDQIGARAILAFAETIEIPANEIPVDSNGHTITIKVEGDFDTFRDQVEQEIRAAQDRIARARSGQAV
jgi:hypothetical protein